MKAKIFKVTGLSLIAASALLITGCTADFEEANRPGDKTSSEELGRDNYSTGSFLVQMQNEAFPEQENTYQMNQDLIGNYLGRYFTYANNGFAGNNFVRMNAPVGWVRYPFADSMPKTVSAFNEIVRLTGTESLSYAWALILRAQSFLRLTDMYGPLPIGAEEEPNAYSSQQKVYHTLVADLDKALGIITPMIQAGGGTLTQFTNSDKVYDGDFTKWVKYANSLKLRMAIRMRLAEPEYARTVAEQAVADGVITSNADNATILYVPNGLYKTSVEWGDSRACADIDSAAKVTQDTRGIWMTAAEMAFCRAEGALAGWNMDGTAEALYNEGITLSFEQWGASGAADYIANSTATPADYVDAADGYGQAHAKMSSITVKWDDNASASEKMERLMVQKWIALFPDGQEAWSEIRRTGYPKVFPSAQSTAYDLTVPNRLPFDYMEPVNNPDNYQKAVQLLGGPDTYATKMWWQK